MIARLSFILALALPLVVHAQTFYPSLRGTNSGAAPTPPPTTFSTTFGNNTAAGFGGYVVPAFGAASITILSETPTGGGSSTDFCVSTDYDGTSGEIVPAGSTRSSLTCTASDYGKLAKSYGTSYVLTVQCACIPLDGGSTTRTVDIAMVDNGFGGFAETAKSHFGYLTNFDNGSNGQAQQNQLLNVLIANGQTPAQTASGIANATHFGDAVLIRGDCQCDPTVTPTILPPLNPLSVTKNSSGGTANTYLMKTPNLPGSGFAATTYAGQQPVTIQSASYNSPTGLVTATLNSSLGASVGQNVSIIGLAGIGVNGGGVSVNNTYVAQAGTGGSTVVFALQAGLTLSFNSGTGYALLPITIQCETATAGNDANGNPISGGNCTMGAVTLTGLGAYGSPFLPSDVTATTVPIPWYFHNITHAYLHALVTNEVSSSFLMNSTTGGTGTATANGAGWTESNGRYYIPSNLAEQCLVYFCAGTKQAGGALCSTHFAGPFYGDANPVAVTDNPGPNFCNDLFEGFVQNGIGGSNLYSPTFTHNFFFNLGSGVPQPHNGMFAEIAGTLYTFVTAPPTQQGQVQIDPGGSWAQTLMNLVCAIDGNTTGGAASNIVNYGQFPTYNGNVGTFDCGDGQLASYPRPSSGLNYGAAYAPTYSAEAPDTNVTASWWLTGPNLSANLTAIATGTAINSLPMIIGSGNVGSCNTAITGCWFVSTTNPGVNLFIGGFNSGSPAATKFGCGGTGGTACQTALQNAGFAIVAGAVGVQATNQLQFDYIHSDCLIYVTAVSPPPTSAGNGFPFGQWTDNKCVLGSRPPNVDGSQGMFMQDTQRSGFPGGYFANNIGFNVSTLPMAIDNAPASTISTNTMMTDFTALSYDPAAPSFNIYYQTSWAANVPASQIDQFFTTSPTYVPPSGITSAGTFNYNLANSYNPGSNVNVTSAVTTPSPNETVTYGGLTPLTAGTYNHLANVLSLVLNSAQIFKVGDGIKISSLTGTGSVASLTGFTFGPVTNVNAGTNTLTVTAANYAGGTGFTNPGSDATIATGNGNQVPTNGTGFFNSTMQALFPNLSNTSVAPCGPPCTPAAIVTRFTPPLGTIFTATTNVTNQMSVTAGWVPIVGTPINGPVAGSTIPAGDIVVGCASPCNAFPYSVTLQVSATGSVTGGSFATGAMNPDGSYNGSYTPNDSSGAPCDNVPGTLFNAALTCAAQGLTPAVSANDVFERWDALPVRSDRPWAA